MAGGEDIDDIDDCEPVAVDDGGRRDVRRMGMDVALEREARAGNALISASGSCSPVIVLPFCEYSEYMGLLPPASDAPQSWSARRN
jgi:hypothetical protein